MAINNEKITKLIKEAEAGNVDAQYDLAYCYWDGDGVEKDLHKAVYWFTKSAEQGFADAQYNIALCYKTGKGIKKDLDKAAEWFAKAAEQGDADAQYSMGLCYKMGEGVEEDLYKASEWFMKAAEQDHANAQEELEYLNKIKPKQDRQKQNLPKHWQSEIASTSDSFITSTSSTFKKLFVLYFVLGILGFVIMGGIIGTGLGEGGGAFLGIIIGLGVGYLVMSWICGLVATFLLINDNLRKLLEVVSKLSDDVSDMKK